MLVRRILHQTRVIATSPYWSQCKSLHLSPQRMSANDREKHTMDGDGKPPYHWPKLVVFGNSITQRGFSRGGYWVAEVADLLVRKCDVLNRGFSGYNTTWNRMILPRIIPAPMAAEVVGVIMLLGANDSTLVEFDKEQHVPLDQYKANLKAMINYLQTVGIPADRVLMIDPPPSDDDHWGRLCQAEGRPNTKCNIQSEKYARACVEVAKECGASSVDLWQNMSSQPNWKEMLCDGLHLSPAGAEFLFSLIKPWCCQVTAHLPFLLPDWKTIDYLNPENSFP